MINKNYLDEFNSPIRKIGSKVELLTSSTETINNSGNVVVAEGKDVRDVTVNVRRKNLFNPSYSSFTKGTYLTLFAANEEMRISFNEKDSTIDLTGINVGFMRNPTNANEGYRWVLNNGTIGAIFSNISADGKYTVCPYIAIYPTTEEAFNKVMARYDIQVEIGTVSTAYTPYIEDFSKCARTKNLFNENIFNTLFGGFASTLYEETETYYKIDNSTAYYLNGARVIYTPNVEFKANTQYTLRYRARHDIGYPRLEILHTDGTREIKQTPQGVEFGEIVLTSIAGKTVENIVVGYSTGGGYLYIEKGSIQLEEGTTATEYAPYLAPAKVYRYGKNLLDISTLPELNKGDAGYKNLTVDVENNTFSFEVSITNYSIGVTMKAYLPVGTYRTSGTVTTVSGLKCGVLVRDEAGNFVVNNGGTSPNTTFTVKTPQTYRFTYYRPYSSPVGDIVTYSNVQLEVGNTTTEYEKYIEPQIFEANSEGIVEGFTAIPNMTFFSNSEGVLLDVGCNCKFSNVEETYTNQDVIKSVKIDRAGELGKFFGFGVAHKATINLIDTNREIQPREDGMYKPYFKIGENDYENTYPNLYIDMNETKRDETTNELSIVACDALYAAAAHTVEELGLEAPYKLSDVLLAITSLLDLKPQAVFKGIELNDLEYAEGANLEGTETLREVLNAIAEITQTVYYISPDNELTFRQLSLYEPDADAYEITKEHYFDFTSKGYQQLAGITHATELGDNLTAKPMENGVIQYVRNNPFWELREDLPTLLEEAANIVAGFNIGEYECSMRGNFLMEIGEFIAIEQKNGDMFVTFVLNDSIDYTGGLAQKISWAYTTNEGETASNPTNLGEAIKQTYARVDKVNKTVDIVVSEMSDTQDTMAALALTTNNIMASVSDVEKNIETTTNELATLTEKVEASITAEDVKLVVSQELDSGVEKVTTSTGFTFDETGLTVSKSNSEISTQITEDGMNVRKGSSEVLTANHEGVKAVDLHATTYLIIGKNSRFEDYGSRTACFWIGGNN